MFRPVDPDLDFIALEHRILELWQAEKTFEQRVALNRGKPRWSFIDGPITANNPMGVHHAWGRSLKDLYLRFHAMTGHELRYQNGFDCQGLWVEVEVEKELGFKSKRDIEAYGIDRFIEKCKERVRTYAARQTEQSIRLGYWMDWSDSYFTMSDENNYCIWTFLRRCHERGWIYKGRDVMPWCPRCGSALSNMELDPESYREVTHRSLYVRFPFTDDPSDGLLVWTTTPWTLAANVAAAVHPERDYVRLDLGGGRSGWAMKELARSVVASAAVLETRRGSELVGRTYRTAMDHLEAQSGIEHRVIPWLEVTETEGTGIVHIAPGCGAEDFGLSKEHGLTPVSPIDEAGVYVDGFGTLSGKFAGSVTAEVTAIFEADGTLVRGHDYTHRYAHCWRCKSEILFRLVDEWFIAMDELRPAIQAVTRTIRWIPDYGMQHELDWLKNMGDWMISKKRYWGLALPIFECDCGWFDVVGSETELEERATAGWDDFAGHSPHRPWVDAVTVRCGGCGKDAHRIPDVGNPWLDAGIVPFSTLGWRKDPDHWKQWFPADFITESLPGQFRNWFYALLCMATVLEDRAPFKTVLGHALVRDEHGKPMHKSEGNAIWFDEAADELGVDSMRWLYIRQNPTANVNFGPGTVGECRRRLLTYWNVYSFFVTYARLDGFDPASPRPASAERSELDRWILSRLNRLVKTANERLADFDAVPVVRAVETFLDELSNWYLRRSRRRFWKGDADADKAAAYATLYECLHALTRTIAPIVPFVTDEVWQNLARDRTADAPTSVHLADYPVADLAAIDDGLEAAVAATRAVVELGRALRQEQNLKIRQPLARLQVQAPSPADGVAIQRFADHIREELNLHEVEVVKVAAGLVDYVVKPDWRALGARFGARTKDIASVVGALSGEETKRLLDAGGVVTVEVVGETLTIEPAELKIEERAKAGVAVREADGFLVALDITITDALRLEGLARDLVRQVQSLRKSAGLAVEDRIRLTLDLPGELGAVIDAWRDYIARETLATEIASPADPASSDVASEEVKVGDEVVRIAVTKAST